MAISRSSDGLWHPSTEAEIVQLVEEAARAGKPLRVRGAAHTAPVRAIYTENFQKNPHDPREINVLLDRFRGVTWDDEKKQVTALAGTHLGWDPYDPAGTSTYQNSIFFQITRRGWALSHTGGISHQTIAGFLSTGSNGGSLTRTVWDDVVAVRLVDGAGRIHVLHRDHHEHFYGALPSMGLWGVITAVTLQCQDRYDVVGQEAITTLEDCACDLDSAGPNGISGYLARHEYARMMWWPQKGAERIVVWQARRMAAGDYDEVNSPGGRFVPKPYLELGKHPEIAASAAAVIYDVFGQWQDEPDKLKTIGKLLPPLIKGFVPLDKKRGPQKFWDEWFHGLPMDNGVDDKKLPIEFSELWIPLDRVAEAMALLRAHYARNGMRATGTLAGEIYGAKANKFWMHPAYGQDMMRFDFLWFSRADGVPGRDFYPQFWELFKELPFRVHWGKHVPSANTPWHGWAQDPGAGSWTAYLRRQYPQWDNFLRIRKEMDPKGIFLTPYWERRLGVTSSGP
jgi:D-arabinono-1,4-lactone oxidase